MFGTTLKFWFARRPERPVRAARHHPRRRLEAETLEVRAVPATFNWVPTLPGAYNWDDAANWSSTGGGFPNAASDVANFANLIKGNQTIALNESITVGTLNLGSLASSSGSYTIVANGGSLSFDASPGNAQLTEAGRGGDSLNAPITLESNLNIAGSGAAPLAIGGDIGGAGTINTSATILQTGNVVIDPGVTLSGTGTFAPTPVLYSTSYYDGALYEFSETSGALLATLVPPNSSTLLQFASGVAVGPDGNLYISNESPDATKPSDSILQYNLQTQTLSTFIDTASLESIATGQGAAYFNPSGIIFGPDGQLYVSLNAGFGDGFGTGGVFHGNVVRFDVNPGSPLTYAGTFKVLSSTALAQPAGLSFGVGAGDTDNLYVNTAGTDDVTKLAGATGSSPTTAEFVPAGGGAAGLEFPSGLAWGPDGKLYVADLGAFDGAGQVVRFNSDGSFDEKFVPVAGDSNGQGSLGLQFPYGLLFDAQGNMLLANFGNNGPTTNHPHDFIGSIYEYDSAGTFIQPLVSYTSFPQTGPDTSFNGIIPSQIDLASAPGIEVDGTLTPAGSGATGIVSTGDLSFGSTGTFDVDLEGTTPGTEYDQLISTGNVELAGTLNIAAGFSPGPGTSFTIISAASVSGTFTGLADGSLITVGAEQFLIKYNANSVTLTTVEAPLITSANTATFYTGKVDNSFQVTANGVPAPTFSVSGTLPDGVSLDPTTGILSGNPTGTGIATFGIKATNTFGSNTQSFTLNLDAGVAPSISSADNTAFLAGLLISFTVTTSGTPTAALFETGALPAGVSFVDNGDGTATLSGAADAGTGGAYPISIRAANGVSPDASQDFTLTINEPPVFTSADSAAFALGAAGTFHVTASGFPAPTFFTGSSPLPPLPTGVTFDPSTDLLSEDGTTPVGTYNIVFAAQNVEATVTQNFTLTIDQAPAITSSASTTFTVGSSGSFTIDTTGFPAAVLTELGPIPSGVTFVDNHDGTATLSGTPDAATGGAYMFTVKAANGVLPNASQDFTLTVDEAPAITSADTTTFTVGSAGSFTIHTTGTPTAAITETGVLPGGVTFVDNHDGTATLAGTPDAGTGNTYSFSIGASNGIAPDASQSFTLTVDQAPAITSANSTTFTVGSSGNFTIDSTGFPAAALTETGALPGGVTFVDNHDGTATLSGAPDAGTGNTYTFSIAAANGVAPDASQSFTLTVDEAPGITSADHTTFALGTSGTFTVEASGFPAPTLAETATLPPGVSFDTATGILSEDGTTPTGVYNLVFTADNGVNPEASQNFTLTVNQAPAITSASSATFTFGQGGAFTVAASGFPTPTLAVIGSLPSGVTFAPATGLLTVDRTAAAGVVHLTFTAANGVSPDASQDFSLTVENLVALSPGLAVGGSTDGQATLYHPDASGAFGTPIGTIALPGITGANVRTAVADVNGDGTPDTILVSGPGTPIRVAVISGADNTTVLVAPFDPFGGGFTGGGFVAAGDFDGDGRAEFVVTPDQGGGPRVSIFSLLATGLTARANYFTVDPDFRGGARAAVGDINGDGVPDLAVAAGFGGGPRIVLINGTDALTTDGFNPADRLVGDFFAFDPTVRNGAYLAIGDVNGDGFGDLIFGAGPGGSPEVLTISGKALLTQGAVDAVANPLSSFFLGGDSSSRGGARVAAVNADNDNLADVAVSTGSDEASFVRVYLGKNFLGGGEPTTFEQLDPFAGAVLTDGVYVG